MSQDFNRPRNFIKNAGDSRTKPEYVSQCGIKHIMQRHHMLGISPFQTPNPDLYGKSVIMTYDEADRLVRATKEAFMLLPSTIRDRFHNNPAKLLNFLEDPKNRDEAIKIGLIMAKEEPKGSGTSSSLVVTGTTDSKTPSSPKKE